MAQMVSLIIDFSAERSDSIHFGDMELHLSEKDFSEYPLVWNSQWFVSLKITDHQVCKFLLQEFTRALKIERKPRNLVKSIRMTLQTLPSFADCWEDLSNCLELCTSCKDVTLQQTADLMIRSHCDADALFRSFCTWFALQVVQSEEDEERKNEVLNEFSQKVWYRFNWYELEAETYLCFAKQFQKSNNAKLWQLLIKGLTLFKNDEISENSVFQKNCSVPLMYVSCLLCLFGSNFVKVDQLVSLVAKTNIGVNEVVHDEWLALAQKMLENKSADDQRVSPASESQILIFFEGLKDQCLANENPRLSLFVILVASRVLLRYGVKPSCYMPMIMRVMITLIRHIGGNESNVEACRALIHLCLNARFEGDEKLTSTVRSVITTFVSSISNLELCLLMLKIIPSNISNPRIATPLIESLIRGYLAASISNNKDKEDVEISPLTLCAKQFHPPSLPADSTSEFPIHDVAICVQSPSSALTLLVILERQRLVTHAKNWEEDFACPSLASVFGFTPDSKRPFELVGLWLWSLKHVVSSFKPSTHHGRRSFLFVFVSLFES